METTRRLILARKARDDPIVSASRNNPIRLPRPAFAIVGSIILCFFAGKPTQAQSTPWRWSHTVGPFRCVADFPIDEIVPAL
ncbi:MAG: hypothetical protein D6741_21725, partial [Planctomycetota bacterium]